MLWHLWDSRPVRENIGNLFWIKEFAKLRARYALLPYKIRVSCALVSSCASYSTCSRSSLAFFPSCSRVLRASHLLPLSLLALVPRILHTVLPYVPLVLNALVAHVSHTLRVLMLHVSHVLLALLLLGFSALPGIVPHVPHVSGNLYPMYSRALWTLFSWRNPKCPVPCVLYVLISTFVVPIPHTLFFIHSLFSNFFGGLAKVFFWIIRSQI